MLAAFEILLDRLSHLQEPRPYLTVFGIIILFFAIACLLYPFCELVEILGAACARDPNRSFLAMFHAMAPIVPRLRLILQNRDFSSSNSTGASQVPGLMVDAGLPRAPCMLIVTVGAGLATICNACCETPSVLQIAGRAQPLEARACCEATNASQACCESTIFTARGPRSHPPLCAVSRLSPCPSA
jgi:hypothetical protein